MNGAIKNSDCLSLQVFSSALFYSVTCFHLSVFDIHLSVFNIQLCLIFTNMFEIDQICLIFT